MLVCYWKNEKEERERERENVVGERRKKKERVVGVVDLTLTCP